ncbi:MAG TPA: MarC family protein [Rhizomicrobium sp.]|nr:MarC family protein [Rhizomicrobium sp.]
MDTVSAFVTLFVVVDPIGLGPIFLALTQRYPLPARSAIALEACVIAFAILAGAALFGQWLLSSLGISIAAFRIAGGLLLFALAFEMVFDRRQSRKEESPEEEPPHPGAFPLAIPLLAGPGAITASVLLGGNAEGGLPALGLLLAVIAAVLLLAYLVFRLTPLMEKLLGRRGQVVFGRLLGVILAALAVQYIADGFSALRG